MLLGEMKMPDCVQSQSDQAAAVPGPSTHSAAASTVEISLGRGIQASQEPELGNGNRVLSGEGMHLDTKMWLVRAEIPKYLSFKTLILF